jgi:hypothetical protein
MLNNAKSGDQTPCSVSKSEIQASAGTVRGILGVMDALLSLLESVKLTLTVADLPHASLPSTCSLEPCF